MCGILFTKNVEHKAFSTALTKIKHRGPDALDSKHFNEYSMGHTRLSVIDLNERSQQPFTASDNKTIIIFNGEIYNYKELKQQFNIRTKTDSDTEILVELYLRFKEKCLSLLNGMFSFIIYNTESREYFVARDRLGIKPLFYYQQGDKKIFSSEISPILSILKNYTHDIIGVRQYLKARTFFNNHTLYKNISSFPAGSYMKNGQIYKYWNIENFNNKSWNDEEVEELIRSAISYRKISDVPMGSYLSGGLDSSIIAAVAQNNDNWTIGFDNLNEFKYAELVKELYGFELHKIKITNEEFKSLATEIIKYSQVPLSVPNEVLLTKMTKEVRKKNVVVLSGEGADELFHGYDRIFKWANKNPFSLESFDQFYSYGKHKDDEILEYILSPVANIKDNFLKISTFFQCFHLHGLLNRLDKTTMLCSVEARVPFVDHRLVEYMHSAKMNYTCKNGNVKDPLKRIFKNILPDDTISRKKVGFPVPLNDIFPGNEDGFTKWFQFNMNVLFHDKWDDIKEELIKEGIYV